MDHPRDRNPARPTGSGGFIWKIQGAIISGLSVAVLFMLLGRVAPGLSLPIFATAVLAAAGILATFAWVRGIRRTGDRISAWDMAGACAFVGFAALVLSRPEQMLQLAAN